MAPSAQSYHIITQIGIGFVTDFKYQNPAQQLQQVCTFLANLTAHSKSWCIWFSLRQQLQLLKSLWNLKWQPPPGWQCCCHSGERSQSLDPFCLWCTVHRRQQETWWHVRQEIRNLQSWNAFSCTWTFNHPCWDWADLEMMGKCIWNLCLLSFSTRGKQTQKYELWCWHLWLKKK